MPSNASKLVEFPGGMNHCFGMKFPKLNNNKSRKLVFLCKDDIEILALVKRIQRSALTCFSSQAPGRPERGAPAQSASDWAPSPAPAPSLLFARRPCRILCFLDDVPG